MKNIKGAIFDCDGVLLDSMPAWIEAEVDYVISLGLRPRDDFVESVRALSTYEVAEYIKTEYNVRKPIEEIIEGRDKIIEDLYFYKIPLKEGVLSVLDYMRDRGVKMCVATASNRNIVEPAFRRCGILGYFEKIFTCSEEATSKNSPDIFIRAASFLGTDISETVVFEDAVHAIRSAKSAGFTIAAVYDISEDDSQDEIKSLCDYYYKSLTDFPF